VAREGKAQAVRKRIRVHVEARGFPSERTVSFDAGGRTYSLVVDAVDVAPDGTLLVYVVDQQNGEALVDLPRDTFTSGGRIRVPSSALLPA
jgi:hypothetical protein